jgi:hypothetical protein
MLSSYLSDAVVSRATIWMTSRIASPTNVASDCLDGVDAPLLPGIQVPYGGRREIGHSREEASTPSRSFGELDTVVSAYATTIHKSQGSEYPAVVITLATEHYTMLARNLVYTAVTRGKRLVVIVGQRRAMAIAVRSGGGRKRWTKLREWLTVN